MPSTRTEPDVTSNSRGMRLAKVVLPDPVEPTMAVVSPGEMTALLDLPPEELLKRVMAIANPTDPGIYLKRAA